MRLLASGSEQPIDLSAVAAGSTTIIHVYIPPLVAGGTIDVLCLRPDGAIWIAGVARSTPGAARWEVELNPFHLEGPHVLFAELNGRRLPGEVRLDVAGAKAARPSRTKGRYKGGGSLIG